MRYNKKRIIILSLVVLLIVTVAIVIIKINGNKDDDEEKMEVVRRGEFVVKLRETGNLEALLSVEVRSNVEGEIEQIFVSEGEFVEEGRELLKIDDEQISEQRNQAEAYRNAQKARHKQAELQIELTTKRQTNEIAQAENSVRMSEGRLEAIKAETRQRITEAETRISTTRNYLEQDDISLRQAQIALEQAQLAYQRAQAASESSKVKLDTAQAEYDRNKELFEKQLVSKRTLEESETRHANAQYEYDTAEKDVQTQYQSVESQKQNIEAREEAIKSRKSTLKQHELGLITVKKAGAAREKEYVAGLENAREQLLKVQETADPEKELTRHSKVSARADLRQAESALAAQEKRLRWTTVKAPISGTVTRIFFEEGEIVTSGRSAFSRGEALMTIADLSKMIVKTRINEVEISKVEVGQEAEVRVETYTDRVFRGRVSEISPGAIVPQQGVENTVITFEVDVEILEAASQLLPGMSADVDIIVFKGEDVLQLPIESVINPEVLTVKATVTGSNLRRLRPDQELKILNLIGKEFEGKVGKIRADASRGNVEILLDGTPRGLRTGPAEVSILISDTNRISNIQAEIGSTKQYYVQLDTGTKESERKKGKDKEMKGIKTRIEVGHRNDSHFEIVSGVDAGDRIFVPSMEQLTRQDEN